MSNGWEKIKCKMLHRLIATGLLPKRLTDCFEKKLKKLLENFEKQFLDVVEGRITENALDAVLNLMSVLFVLDKDYRKNIEGLEAVLVFTDQADDFYVAATFHKNRLKVSNKKVSDPSLTLRFRDNDTLIKLLFSGSADILNALLNQWVSIEGNVNYLCKFGYMALHPLLKITGGQSFAEA